MTNNSIPEICDLDIRIDQSTPDDGLSCVTELRLINGEIPIGDEDCDVSLSKLTISVDVAGLIPIPGTRYGEPRKQNRVLVDKSLDQTQTGSSGFRLGMDVELNGSMPFVKLDVGVATSKKTERVAKAVAKEKFEHHRVRAIPNLSWEVSEYDGTALDGTYLDNDQLVGLTRAAGANQTLFEAKISVKQRHITIRPLESSTLSTSVLAKFDDTKKRLMDIFIAKSLSAAVSRERRYSGEIMLSSFRTEIDEE